MCVCSFILCVLVLYHVCVCMCLFVCVCVCLNLFCFNTDLLNQIGCVYHVTNYATVIWCAGAILICWKRKWWKIEERKKEHRNEIKIDFVLVTMSKATLLESNNYVNLIISIPNSFRWRPFLRKIEGKKNTHNISAEICGKNIKYFWIPNFPDPHG